jgi:hypothetical protein
MEAVTSRFLACEPSCSSRPCAAWRSRQGGLAAGDPDRELLAQAGDQVDQQRRVPRGLLRQRQQAEVGGGPEYVVDQRGHRILAEPGQAHAAGPVLLKQVEQMAGVVMRRGRPGENPGHRVLPQVAGERAERGQRGGARPLQVVHAHQDRRGRRPGGQVIAHLADPPHRRVRLPPLVALGGDRGERLAKRPPHREERYRLAQRVPGADGERESEPGRLADGVPQQGRLPDAGFALDQQHAAAAALRAQQHVAYQPPLRAASTHGVHVTLSPCPR